MEDFEARMRSDIEDRERCLKDELKAMFKGRLAVEQERRFKAEEKAQQLAKEIKRLRGAMPSQDACGEDYEADERCQPLLREEVCLLASPQDDGGGPRLSPAEQLLEDGAYKSEEHMHLSQLEGLDFDFYPLPCDMWGVAIMVLSMDVAELSEGQNVNSHLTRFLYALGCVLLNLVMQLSILRWVYMYVVGDSVFGIQGNYAQFHRDVFSNTTNEFNTKAWVNWDGDHDSLCGAVLTKGVFLGVILFLWVGRMTGEWKSCIRLSGAITQLPTMPSGATLSKSIVRRNDENHIIAMTCGTRFMLFCLVIVPKMFICIVLAFIGLQWLTSTQNFSDLILNVMALEFIVNIDEQILQSFLPARCTKNLDITRFAYPATSVKTRAEQMAAVQKDYWRNIWYFLFAVGFTYLYYKYGQQVLPHFTFDIHQNCEGWYENRFSPKCSPLEKGCFPFGDNKAVNDYSEMTPADLLD